MTLRIAINGFGRIGRVVTRLLSQRLQAGASTSQAGAPRIELVAINDLGSPEMLAHLLRFDSVHGRFSDEVSLDNGVMKIGSQSVRVLSEREPAKLPWKELGVDVVLECTGIFRSKAQAGLHIEAGAKRVIVSAPSPDPDLTLAYGVNSNSYDPSKHQVLSCASCTTNCLAPVAKVLLENFGIQRGVMTTIHSYTNDQRILDLPHDDLRRARAAALSSIPTTTGAAKAVGLVLPELKGKVDGFAIRVPTPNVSLVDFVAEIEADASKEDVNSALLKASQGPLKGILGFSEEPLVSCDYMGDIRSSIVDAQLTMVIGKRMVKVISWYDNEAGFSARMLDTCEMIARES
jgi:glyceraldehyde 3-phosphate dehydrogenase